MNQTPHSHALLLTQQKECFLFEVIPQFPATTAHKAVDLIFLLLVYVDSIPEFVVEINPLDDLRYNFKCQEADIQLRRRPWFSVRT
ncbi:MAG: hypothetical protein NXY57DRAFT_1017594 [Lentinula lateritia]|uniref:Uncharacterized protein n=1 Tax=Lentinula lateritia TaxID=40482 RepID=A0ABQ8VKF5_9AGAR|nr:MAG: hypothetical protein NXY57DRAFT_1017594 [Lentinula lateritia]KAJ4496865.1 hypothetical protein C8R41DRAFT_251052 [Lentinula lateritia]